MNLKHVSIALTIGFLFAAHSAMACSIAPLPPMTDEERIAYEKEQEQEFLKFAKNAKAIVEIRAITSSRRNISTALVEISKVYYGRAKKGKVLKLKTVGGSLCGPGGVRRGERGITILEKGRGRIFQGLLPDYQIDLLRKAGLITDATERSPRKNDQKVERPIL